MTLVFLKYYYEESIECALKKYVSVDIHLMDYVVSILNSRGYFRKWTHSVTLTNQQTYILSFGGKECIRILDVGGSVLQNNYYFSA